MRSCFRSLERRGVHYLLISGQASVLYGAAEFSEDVDLWVAPDAGNVRALQDALRDAGARVHKLTPPLLPRHFRRGHGFHFVLPEEGAEPLYLDVMGRPPRVGSYRSSARASTVMRTHFGKVPVVGIPDLVELKKTRRLADYEVISKLVVGRLRTTGVKGSVPLLRWGLANCFRIEDAEWILETWPRSREMVAAVKRPWLKRLARAGRSGAPPGTIQVALNVEIARLQRMDTEYWSAIINELRAMRREGSLLREGLPLK